MENEKVVIAVGEEFTVDFQKNQNGGKPVCRIDGMVCFIENSCKDLITPSSSWMVAIVAIHEKHMIIKPIYRVRTAKENHERLNLLIAAFQPVVKDTKVKVTVSYPYRTANEIKKLKDESKQKG